MAVCWCVSCPVYRLPSDQEWHRHFLSAPLGTLFDAISTLAPVNIGPSIRDVFMLQTRLTWRCPGPSGREVEKCPHGVRISVHSTREWYRRIHISLREPPYCSVLVHVGAAERRALEMTVQLETHPDLAGPPSVTSALAAAVSSGGVSIVGTVEKHDGVEHAAWRHSDGGQCLHHLCRNCKGVFAAGCKASRTSPHVSLHAAPVTTAVIVKLPEVFGLSVTVKGA